MKLYKHPKIALFTIVVAFIASTIYLIKPLIGDSENKQTQTQTSNIEQNQDLIPSQTPTSSAEVNEENFIGDGSVDDNSLIESVEEAVKKLRKEEINNEYSMHVIKMNVKQEDQVGNETLEDGKLFLFKDYEDYEIKDVEPSIAALVTAFEYGKSGKDPYYITSYYDENGSYVGYKYIISTPEVDIEFNNAMLD